MKTREHLAALVAHGNVLVLDLLRYASELRDPSRLHVPGANLRALRIAGRELEMAERLIAEMSGRWKPEQYRDEYRGELLAFIKRRARAGKLAAMPEPQDEPTTMRRGQVIDIAELLRKSLAKAGPRRRKESRRPRRKQTA